MADGLSFRLRSARAIDQAQGALAELAKLLPSHAVRIIRDPSGEDRMDDDAAYRSPGWRTRARQARSKDGEVAIVM